MVATDKDGYIWIYDTASSTWTASTYAGTEPWTATAISADGSVIVVGTGPGAVFVSKDGGATWAQETGGGIQNWSCACVAESWMDGWGVFGQCHLWISQPTCLN